MNKIAKTKEKEIENVKQGVISGMALNSNISIDNANDVITKDAHMQSCAKETKLVLCLIL